MKKEIFKSYDIRGIYPKEIDPEVAYQIAQSVPKILGPGKIMVAYDVRHGSPEMALAVKKGLEASAKISKKKVEVVPIGLSTTPMFYFLVNHLKASGGVMATASHNPKEYNGLKIVGQKAKMISGQEVGEQVFKDKNSWSSPNQRIKKQKPVIKSKHLNSYLTFLKSFFDLEKPIKVVLDCSNGATGIATKKLFQNQKNLTAYFINDKPDPDFKTHGPNPSAPGASAGLAKEVKKRKAHLGVAFDADGDRAVVIDNKGRVLPAFVTAQLLFSQKSPPFVADELVFKSLMHTNFPKNKVSPSKVGTFNIRKKMEEKKASVGAEFSGHFYFKEFFGADSGLLTSILASNQVSRLPHALATFVEKLPQQKVLNKNIKLSEDKDPEGVVSEIKQKFQGKAKIEKREGVTLEFGESWINIRKSNTEPVIRLVAGAGTLKDCKNVIEKVRKSAGV